MKIKYFITPHCSTCHALEPRAKKLAEHYDIPFETVDLAANPEAKGKYLLFSAPALLFLDGEKEMKRFVRNFGLNEVEDFILRFQD
ncbi:MAG TPA: thioredoxin family protein [Salinivirga sp.]|uniref:thioredoxin family protein n=1 Tax=Salinivirga sp. TaxID=1970192 RepID=UPI002B470DA5|nr:thioredoxin family protein [Salinivirga sp.]HKK60238.1 thioredoxin family protein [Salinivirga sp.]